MVHSCMSVLATEAKQNCFLVQDCKKTLDFRTLRKDSGNSGKPHCVKAKDKDQCWMRVTFGQHCMRNLCDQSSHLGLVETWKTIFTQHSLELHPEMLPKTNFTQVGSHVAALHQRLYG